MTDQLLSAWRSSNRANLLLIDHLRPEGLQCRLAPRGRTIGEQLAHVHNTRLQWLATIDPGLHGTLLPLPKETSPDGAGLLQAFEASAAAIESLITTSMDAGGKLKGYKKGIIPFISYLVAHEAHHRGHALLTLKQSGHKLDEPLKWGLWEW